MASTPSIYGADLIEQHVQKAHILVSKDPEFVAKTSYMLSLNKLGTGYTLRITRAKQKVSHRLPSVQAVTQSIYGTESIGVQLWKANEKAYRLVFFGNCFKII